MLLRPYILDYIFPLIPTTRCFKVKAYILRKLGVILDSSVKVSSKIKIYGRGKLTIGSSTWVGIDIKFFLPSPAKITIGENCDIAPNVTFICGSHLIGSSNRRAGMETTGDIEIGSGTWIGAGTTVLPNAKIGTGCMIAAGAVVTAGKYPPNSLIGGVPAKVIKSLPAQLP